MAAVRPCGRSLEKHMLAGLSPYYVLFMIIIGTQVHLMYSGDISSTEIVIIAYFLMLVVFAAGFMYQWLRRKP